MKESSKLASTSLSSLLLARDWFLRFINFRTLTPSSRDQRSHAWRACTSMRQQRWEGKLTWWDYSGRSNSSQQSPLTSSESRSFTYSTQMTTRLERVLTNMPESLTSSKRRRSISTSRMRMLWRSIWQSRPGISLRIVYLEDSYCKRNPRFRMNRPPLKCSHYFQPLEARFKVQSQTLSCKSQESWLAKSAHLENQSLVIPQRELRLILKSSKRWSRNQMTR